MMTLTVIQKVIIWVVPIILAITIHEAAHAWMAAKCGDKTAQMLGRLSLNPVRHIDLMGTIIIPILLLIFGGFVFGWAKPVPINSANFKHPRRDLALVSLAGPLSNLIMAILWAGVTKLGDILYRADMKAIYPLILMGSAGIVMNIVLAVVNLIPIPPLDGGHFVINLLPRRIAYYYGALEHYGLLIILVLLASGILNTLINPIIQTLYGYLMMLFHL